MTTVPPPESPPSTRRRSCRRRCRKGPRQPGGGRRVRAHARPRELHGDLSARDVVDASDGPTTHTTGAHGTVPQATCEAREGRSPSGEWEHARARRESKAKTRLGLVDRPQNLPVAPSKSCPDCGAPSACQREPSERPQKAAYPRTIAT